ncbi:hypothetical protein DFQ27_005501 [Actinomortierella ambigua]|uniref:STEEP1 domain-containing protein n=1 Tax=Actinomortierella ambigua TaxID=1343610 RepID=A0A9P6PYX2_9FUNG|nr:hypothetical protein DFQ27_005501 [Actinomortierella ambigua]
MPRIVSRSTISSSDNQEEARGGLHSYYCLCSEFLLVIDTTLDALPRRQSDNAYIVANATRTYNLHAARGDDKIVKRGEDKFEKQYRLYCQRCNAWIAYEVTPHLKGGPYTYIVQGALSEVQGVPHEDWELDLKGEIVSRQQAGPSNKEERAMDVDQDIGSSSSSSQR